MLFDRGRCIFLTGMCIVLHIRYCCTWATACARSWCRSEQRSGEVCSSACSQFSVPSLQSIALCSNHKGTGAMLVVSKASRKSSITCCAKGANNAPCVVIHCEFGRFTFFGQYVWLSGDLRTQKLWLWVWFQCIKILASAGGQYRKTQHKLKLNFPVSQKQKTMAQNDDGTETKTQNDVVPKTKIVFVTAANLLVKLAKYAIKYWKIEKIPFRRDNHEESKCLARRAIQLLLLLHCHLQTALWDTGKISISISIFDVAFFFCFNNADFQIDSSSSFILAGINQIRLQNALLQSLI